MGEPADWEVRDERGRVVGVNLPDRGVWMANHQTLSDWLYLWSFAYFTKHHSSVFITLKDSLKWIPFVGWACQLFGFIFLSRKWVNDKGPFKKQLEVVAHGIEGASGDEKKLLLLIFPEGTLVTGNTRPLSKAFADKTGVTDLSHTLLPRSTGLFFALRSLAPLIPTLSLIDLTVGYPGPDASSSKWPEDYYDLTLWYKGLPPPSLHIHIRKWEVKTQVPLGTSEGEGTDAEKKVFEAWLRERWDEKDALMKRFVEEGSFVSSPLGDKFGNGKEAAVNGTSHKVSIPGYAAGRRDGEVSMPIRLRSAHENLGAFAYFLAPLLLWFVVPILFAGVVGVVSKIAGGSSGDAVKLMPDGSPCGCGKATTSAAAGRLGEL
ncbi:acyltransferase-domain-containing protein [Meredithblackwellia eburnea MCA 4105]